MPTAQKARVIEQAKEWYDKSVGFVFTDYRGLKVRELQQLRRNLSAKGGELHIVKNTLFRLAAGEGTATFPSEFHNGPTAVAFLYENESECAKVLTDFAKQTKTLAIKGGYFGGRVFDSAGVEAMGKLPPRDVLVAQLIGTIVAPLTQLVGVIEALYADPIRTIGAVADKVAESSPVPAPAEVAAGPAPFESEAVAVAAIAESTELPEEPVPAKGDPSEAPEPSSSSPAEEAPAPAEAAESTEGEGESS